MKVLQISIALLVGLFCSTISYGQIAPDVWSNRIYQREMLRIVGNGAVNRALLNKHKAGRRGSAPAPAKRKIAPATGPASFKYADKYVMAELASKEFQGTAQEKSYLTGEITKAIDEYKAYAAETGFPANDLGFAMAHNFLQYFFAHTNITCMNNSVAQYKSAPSCMSLIKLNSTDFETDTAIVEQFRAVIVGNPEITKLADREKELLAENIIVKTHLFMRRYREANENTDTAPLLGIKVEAAQAIEGLFGTSADNVSVSRQGIQIKK